MSRSYLLLADRYITKLHSLNRLRVLLKILGLFSDSEIYH
jgi:hypothetical protein